MVTLKEQRIGVFVDVQNLYYSAKNLYNSKVNFANVLKEVVGGRKLIRAIAYVIRTEAMTEKTFHEALENMGFEIMAKDLQIFYGGAKKGDWDVGISMDIIESAPKLDVVVLVSGDGDFVPAIHHARSSGCLVEACSFGRSASSMLKNAVTKFHDLDKQKDRYLIKGSKISGKKKKSVSGKPSKSSVKGKKVSSVSKVLKKSKVSVSESKAKPAMPAAEPQKPPKL